MVYLKQRYICQEQKHVKKRLKKAAFENGFTAAFAWFFLLV